MFTGRKKKAPPPPPSQVNKPKLAPPQEEPEPAAETQRKSQTLPPVVTASAFTADAREKSKTVSRLELNNNNNNNVVEPDLSPATSSSLSSLSRSDDVDRGTLPEKPPTVLKYSKIPLSFLSSGQSAARNNRYNRSSVTLNDSNDAVDRDNSADDGRKTAESWNRFLEHLNDVLACKNEEYV